MEIQRFKICMGKYINVLCARQMDVTNEQRTSRNLWGRSNIWRMDQNRATTKPLDRNFDGNIGQGEYPIKDSKIVLKKTHRSLVSEVGEIWPRIVNHGNKLCNQPKLAWVKRLISKYINVRLLNWWRDIGALDREFYEEFIGCKMTLLLKFQCLRIKN